MTATTHRAIVLGAGCTGLLAATRLASHTLRLDVRITPVNPAARFIERLRRHQIATGQNLTNHHPRFQVNPGKLSGLYRDTDLRG